jgi:hypothetical protein
MTHRIVTRAYPSADYDDAPDYVLVELDGDVKYLVALVAATIDLRDRMKPSLSAPSGLAWTTWRPHVVPLKVTWLRGDPEGRLEDEIGFVMGYGVVDDFTPEKGQEFDDEGMWFLQIHDDDELSVRIDMGHTLYVDSGYIPLWALVGLECKGDDN